MRLVLYYPEIIISVKMLSFWIIVVHLKLGRNVYRGYVKRAENE